MLPGSLYWDGVLDCVIPDRKLPAKMKQDGNRKRAQNMTSRKFHQRRAVYHEFLSPESLRQKICMLLLCSYVQSSDFPRADQSPDEMSFTSLCLLLDALLGLSAIAFAPSLSSKMSTRMPLSFGWKKIKTAVDRLLIPLEYQKG